MWLLLLLSAAIIVLNYRALNSVIPFRGDETLHIERTLELVRRMPFIETLVIVILFILFVLSGIKKQKLLPLIGLLITACVISFFLGRNSFEDIEQTPAFFLRYPFINYWFYAILPKLVSRISSPYHEALYRIIPILSMIGTAWVFQKKSDISNFLNAIAWGFAVATIPLIIYYSSILYIEPPAVLLMTIVCLDINNLLHKDGQDILHTPSWYALILIGFIKETTVPFLLCFVAIRLIVQLQSWSKRSIKDKTLVSLLAREIGITFSVLLPAFFYLYFRATIIPTRRFSPQILNLFDPTIYPLIIQSFVDQFGLFLFFFIGGCILLLRNQECDSLVCYLAMIVSTLAFHILDSKEYIGYSRFNLLILPPILAGSIKFVKWATKEKQSLGVILVFAAIGINLLLSPINLDGVKEPYWGNYINDTSEHYYPYQDALLWLKNSQTNQRILFTGLDFYYPFQFYWNKLAWKPKRASIVSEDIGSEQLTISSILKTAESENYDIVVYRVLGKDLVLPQETNGFHANVIKNSAHSLIIFYRP